MSIWNGESQSIMCKCNGESVNHHLLHSPFATDLWSMVLELFGVCWVMPKTVVELLSCWSGHFHHHRNEHLWMAALHCLMWCIWRERNNRSLENIKGTMLDLKLFFLITFLDWMSLILVILYVLLLTY